MTSRFLTPLVVQDIDGERWLLVAPLVFAHAGRTYTVPAGVTTDLASIPRVVFWRTKSGKYNEAAVVHDAAYAGRLGVVPPKTLTREDADQLFLAGMAVLGVGRWSRWVMFTAVRLCGSRLWRGVQETT